MVGLYILMIFNVKPYVVANSGCEEHRCSDQMLLSFQVALVIMWCSGSTTSDHVISEARYIQCVAEFIARG